MKSNQDISGYTYSGAKLSKSHAYLFPSLFSHLDAVAARLGPGGEKKLFDLGCGNGSVAAACAAKGWDVTGVDVSADGIAAAQKTYPQLKLETGSAYDDLAAKYGQFPAVISLEVVEHVYAPRHYARTLHDLLLPGGTAIVSTPYHGYVKNLAMAVTGKMDKHFTALWDHGHIKFWSISTLSELLEEAGLKIETFDRVGRVPALAKSMVAIARRPG
jgi:2-polyprenyl-6-hydroxyphenyl methylase/3-demethylubiquinone-9 3-methyltransferase